MALVWRVPCSTYSLRDDAHWRWQRRVPMMKSSRFSITFHMTQAGKTAIENLTNPAQWMIGKNILIKTAYRKYCSLDYVGSAHQVSPSLRLNVNQQTLNE